MVLIPNVLLPSFLQISGDLGVLGEKTVFMRDAEMIQHGLDHLEMGYQNRLGSIRGKVVIALIKARPDPRRRLPKGLRIQLSQVQTRLEPVVELISLETTH